MRYIFLAPLIFVLINTSADCTKPGSADADKSQKHDSLVTISLSVVGDIMCHSVQYNYARVTVDSFNFDPVFSEIKEYLHQSDFLFGNLETVAAGKKAGYSGYPLFNSPDAFIRALKDAGFDLLTTANNHAIDRGESGIRRTVEQLKINHLSYNGTFVSGKDRDSIRIFDIKGIKIAFLAYTYGMNGNLIPKGKDYLINVIDTSRIRNDIKLARKKGIDAVLVHFHFGEEYKRWPDSYQKEVVDKTIEYGADIIIGGHTHVLQPIGFFKTNNTKLDSGFVIYSMGNFISNQRWRFSDGGAVLSFSLTKNITDNSVHLKEVDYLPIWVFRGETETGRKYIIIPSEAAFSDSLCTFLSAADRKLAAQSFHDTKEILTKYSQKPHLKDIHPNGIFGIKRLSFH